ncbi:MAG: N-acyl-D-aspartate/D-glutamate deacylase/Imidazolonepropionase [Chloroflexi bacterium]|jgi:N-acyl-D-aspartate/D-glutamate deacylase|nr:MAG: N-acyl-D-aspartate/D-glutamate deacylase/Imidazolonepropionase [Chloroflexota bacterium]
MAYDLLIKGGRIIDGSGMPSFHGDLGVKNGKIVEAGKLTGAADRTIDVGGLVVAPGFIDNHCHYDAQAFWDPMCSFSSYHGSTSAVIGNCSLALAPAHEGDRAFLSQMLARVESIPLEVLEAGVPWNWETYPEYMDALGENLGINLGCLMGHSAIRRYVMGEAAQERQASVDEINAMKAIVRSGLEAGALGLSSEYNTRHFDMQGKQLPASVASTEELFSLASVLGELGTGSIQYGDSHNRELSEQLCSRLSEEIGRPVVYIAIVERAIAPGHWKQQLDHAGAKIREGIRAYPLVNPRPGDQRFTMKTAQHFDSMPTWKRVMLLPLEERKAAFRDSEVRRQLHIEGVETVPNLEEAGVFTRRWDLAFVHKPALEKNASLKGKTIEQMASDQGKGVIDALLDLVLEEDLETEFERREVNSDTVAMTEILNSPYAIIGLSDGGAHLAFRTDYSFTTYFLSHYVRELGIMPLEKAVRKLTLDSATVYGITDRGMLRPGLAADIVVFDPDTIDSLEPEEAFDLPGGAKRRKQLAKGIEYTIVNGQVVLERNQPTGALPGRVLRNSLAMA